MCSVFVERLNAGQGSSSPRPAPREEHLSDDLLEQYLAEIGTIPLLSAEEEYRIATRVQAGDEQAKQQFIEANLRLVVHIAKQYQGSGRDLLDLIQDGNIGLMRAVEHFEPQKGYKFSTYAYHWVKQGIQRGLENTGRTVRLPAYLVVRIGMVARTRGRLFEELGSDPTNEQIAAQVGMDVALVEQARHAASYQMLSLDKPVSGHDETTLGELLPDPRLETSDDLLYREEDEQEIPERVQAMLTCLTEREQQVIILCFGLDGVSRHRSYAEIGRELGICRERVRQVLGRALLKLRQAARREEKHHANLC